MTKPATNPFEKHALRTCAKCQKDKPPGAFGPKVVGDWKGLDSYCRECRAEMARERREREKDREVTREQQTVRLALELADQIDRGVRNPDRLWLYGRWLRRQNWRVSGYGGSDIKPYDLTLERQARYAIEHFTGEDLRRQASQLLAARGETQ